MAFVQVAAVGQPAEDYDESVQLRAARDEEWCIVCLSRLLTPGTYATTLNDTIDTSM